MARRMRIEVKREGATTQSPSPRDEIAKVAYELFERRGHTPGHDLEDWLEAERIVRQRQRSQSAR